jgi:hypothetical protein
MTDYTNAVYRELADELLQALDGNEPGSNKFLDFIKRLKREKASYIWGLLEPFPSAMETLRRICGGKSGPTPLAVKLQDMKLIEPIGNGNGNWLATELGYQVYKYDADLTASAGVVAKDKG